MKGYRLRSDIVFRDLNRLVSAFLAIGPVRDLAENKNDPLIRLQERCTEDEIVHLLVGTAISNRLQMEHMQALRDDPAEMSFKAVEGTCGSLWPNSQKEKEIPLRFREACNKIIHAESIEIFDAARPVLRLFGTHRGTEWMAFVEIVDYAKLSVNNFEDALA